jgi:ornithine cyclodeaminase/alanine dehydrogenase-like protein (mu-crystallin family)
VVQASPALAVNSKRASEDESLDLSEKSVYKKDMNLRLIDKDTVKATLAMPRAIELMRDGFIALSAGEVDSPLRTALVNDAGTVLYKPAYSDVAGIFCAKVVSVFSDNVNKNLPVTPGIIIVNSAETGMPVALVEAGYLTSLRTGAAIGLATDLMAADDAKTAALFGTGGQSAHQLEAMLCVRKFETIYVFSRNPENAVSFCSEQGALAKKVGCTLVANPDRSVIKLCDVITLATSSPTAVVADHELPVNVHINAIGSLGPKRTEVASETMLRSYVCLDQRDACMAEAGELCLIRDAGQLPENFYPVELGELAAGSYQSPKTGVRVFKSVGNAVQDLVCTAEILKIAEEKSLGAQASL